MDPGLEEIGVIAASIDPGIRATGIALWRDGRLASARLVRIPDAPKPPEAWTLMARRVRDAAGVRDATGNASRFVIEFPRTYGGRSVRGSTDDLLVLAGLVGTIAELLSDYGTVELVHPQDWKGGTPKTISKRRTEGRLFEDELGRIDWAGCPASLEHNVWDSIGIGLKAFGTGRAVSSSSTPKSSRRAS